MPFLGRYRRGQKPPSRGSSIEPQAASPSSAFKPIVGDTSFLIAAMKGSVRRKDPVAQNCYRLFKALAVDHRFQFNRDTWEEFESMAKLPEVTPSLTPQERNSFVLRVSV